ncbi:hypothetical protein NL676_038612 [Syzygium grande]|nr:hypothetical protein NL676_038612 [Syzygium grande]
MSRNKKSPRVHIRRRVRCGLVRSTLAAFEKFIDGPGAGGGLRVGGRVSSPDSPPKCGQCKSDLSRSFVHRAFAFFPVDLGPYFSFTWP